jgi:alanine-glyoxylate transaminase / serine-glyoxylate transaminase / serine-pyruvate transaminase
MERLDAGPHREVTWTPFFAALHPFGVGAGIVSHVGAERREYTVRKENPFHAGNLLDCAIWSGTRWRSRACFCHDAPVPISDRLLMGPGPSNPYPEVAQALAGPVLGHLDPDFLAILDDVNERLRQVFATQNGLTLPLSGTGSAGMEASFVNFVRAGDPVVIGVNGVFGERMCDLADRLGAEVIRVDAPWGTSIQPDALLSAHAHPSIIAVVHAETSTGVRNDIEPLGARKGDALLLVDMVTSLGGSEVAVDDWNVDIAYSGTQKCLGVPPGLSPLTVSDRARERMVERPSSWYLDLNMLSRYVQAGAEGGRVYHHTAPVTMIAALHAGLGAILGEGLLAARARHAECGQLLQDGLEALGLTLFAQADHRLPQLTTVEVPPGLPRGMTEADCRRVLLQRYGIEIGAGAGQLAGKVWRIGCMGHTARRRNVLALLGALREVLDR